MNLPSNTFIKTLLRMNILGKVFVYLSRLFNGALLGTLLFSHSSAHAESTVIAPTLSAAIAQVFIQKAESGTYQASIHHLQLIQSNRSIELDAEVVATDESRARGLMFRFDLPENYGMLFVFPDSQQRCFWMKNTYIPLSIAYIDEFGKIVSLHDMQAHDLSSVCSSAPAMYALEVKQGWFTDKAVKIGDTIRIKQH
ncbi:MAG: DUF192 domain-containing protein [Pelistega sp.]|nr:DUF192 domain-containing protein [Pelistega sp.]